MSLLVDACLPLHHIDFTSDHQQVYCVIYFLLLSTQSFQCLDAINGNYLSLSLTYTHTHWPLPNYTQRHYGDGWDTYLGRVVHTMRWRHTLIMKMCLSVCHCLVCICECFWPMFWSKESVCWCHCVHEMCSVRCKALNLLTCTARQSLVM